MAALTSAGRLLGIDGGKWARVGPDSARSAGAMAIVASLLLALNRFGGLVAHEPRAFLRLALVGVWGWIGLGLLTWAGTTIAAVAERHGTSPSLRLMLAVAGLAHVPLIWLSLVLLVAANALQFILPGQVMVAFVLGFWLPAVLISGVHATAPIAPARAVAVSAGAYVPWLVVVGRHLQVQLGHLV